MIFWIAIKDFISNYYLENEYLPSFEGWEYIDIKKYTHY